MVDPQGLPGAKGEPGERGDRGAWRDVVIVALGSGPPRTGTRGVLGEHERPGVRRPDGPLEPVRLTGLPRRVELPRRVLEAGQDEPRLGLIAPSRDRDAGVGRWRHELELAGPAAQLAPPQLGRAVEDAQAP